MLTVRDIMATDVIVVAPGATLRELAQVMSDAQISGVPVVSSSDTLVGVVSAADIVRFASEPPLVDDRPTWMDTLDDGTLEDVPYFFRGAEATLGRWMPIAQEARPSTMDETTVQEIMTSVPFTIPPETSVATLAQFLSERRIHRAIVTGTQGLAGIVTTFDVLQACHTMLISAAGLDAESTY